MPSASRIRGRLAHGGVLLVPVRVQGQDFEFLVDAGAAYTALSRDVVALLGIPVDLHRTMTIAPAQGRTFRVPLTTIPEFHIGGFQLGDVMAIVLDFSPELKIDGVVGMNVLRQFRVAIEADTRTLILRHIARSP